MDGSELVQLDIRRTELSDAHHLGQLLVADKGLIYFEDGLLEDEVHRVSEDILRVRFDHMLPDLFI